MSLGVSGLASLLSGAAQASFSAKINIASFDSVLNGNNVIAAILNGTTVGAVLSIDGTGGVAHARLAGRSVSGDARQAVTGGTQLNVGQTYFIGGIIDYAADTITVYVNGVSDGSSGVTFANTTFTLGTPTGADTVGGYLAPPGATADQFAGALGEIAVWTSALTGTDFSDLASGVVASSVSPGTLVEYLKIGGIASPEVATAGVNGTITGALPLVFIPPTGGLVHTGRAPTATVAGASTVVVLIPKGTLVHTGRQVVPVVASTTTIVRAIPLSGLSYQGRVPGAIIGQGVYTLTINEIPRLIQPGWNISAPANGIGRMSFQIISLDGSYTPELDNEVVFTDPLGVRAFGGNITNIRERGLASKGVTPIVYEIVAEDFNALAKRLYYEGPIITQSLKRTLQAIVPFIPNVTLDSAQSDGPTLPAFQVSALTINKVLDQLADMTNWVWRIDYQKLLRMYAPGTLAAPYNIVAGPSTQAEGDVTVEWSRVSPGYANHVLVWGDGFNSVTASAPEIAAHGYWQMIVLAPEMKSQAEVDALGAAVLAASLVVAKKVGYETFNQSIILPGMTQTINLPLRHINNTFLVSDVQTRNVGNLVKRRVSTLEGVVYQTGWREVIKSWGGSSGAVTVGGGVSGTIGFVRFAYFLGGSGLEFVQSPSPTWVPASAVQVQINTVPRGTNVVTVVARLRALSAGVGVSARLFDLTTSTACPEISPVVTSTTWQTVTWTVTITAGSHFYELQLLPTAPNEDVGAVAYLE